MPTWDALLKHAGKACDWDFRALLDASGRFEECSFSCRGPDGIEVFLDYSRQRVTAETLRLLLALAREKDVGRARADLLAREVVNLSENRPALHPDARAPQPQTTILSKVRDATRDFAERFRAGKVSGASGKPLSRIVNIGIGGSDLGVRLLCSALAEEDSVPVHFVTEMDGVQLEQALASADPHRTLFVVCSKSFATAETMANAYSARHWLVAALGKEAPAKHFAAVSSSTDAMKAWGIAPKMQFRMPEGVGGRYSIWSAAGLSAWLSLSGRTMEQFLAGARWMDEHFADAPLDRNLPVLMALLALWNQSFLDCSSQLLLPYDTRLARLPAYLQQLLLESLGKSNDAQGRPLTGKGVAPIWGVSGSSAQHSIMQWAQQGDRRVCADFIAARQTGGAYPGLHAQSLRHMLAQAETLARGLSRSEIENDPLADHKALPGGRPSSVLLLNKVDPTHLGALLALYEHQVFVQAVLLGVNPFDQWGVEHAKRLAEDESAQPPLANLLGD